jgi:hypothetical protein
MSPIGKYLSAFFVDGYRLAAVAGTASAPFAGMKRIILFGTHAAVALGAYCVVVYLEEGARTTNHEPRTTNIFNALW